MVLAELVGRQILQPYLFFDVDASLQRLWRLHERPSLFLVRVGDQALGDDGHPFLRPQADHQHHLDEFHRCHLPPHQGLPHLHRQLRLPHR